MREITSERFTTKENEQILKEVNVQEVNSWVQTPRSDNPASGHRLRQQLQRFETLEKKSNVREFVKKQHSREESLLG